jgi:acetoin utilization protein AcuC
MTHFEETLQSSGRFDVVLNETLASDEDLSLWHEKDYIQTIRDASSGVPVWNLWRYISGDNVNSRTGKFPMGIEDAARVIVKNSMLACDLVEDGKYEKAVSLGGGLHHAKSSYGEGFCVYNDVVISARHLIKKYALDRILILDTDAHAGNGTFDAFNSDPRVLLVDLHQRGIYPGTGFEHDIGAGKGKGFMVNVPLTAFAGDEDYRLVFDELVFPLAEEFHPQFVIRNGGSDPHFDDPLAQLGLTLDGFHFIGESVRKVSKVCDGKEVDLICSGYTPHVLARAWTALLAGLAGIKLDEKLDESSANGRTRETLEETAKVVNTVKRNLRPYWTCMDT